MAQYGIIDLGSNTIRLVVFSVEEETADHKPSFRALINQKKMAGLSTYVVEGVLTQEGINKAVEVLTKHLETLSNFDCKRSAILATAVLRNCTNSKEAVKAISEAIGMPIDLLSGAEEARLGFVGACLRNPMDQGTLIDIGGGSTEITAIRKGQRQESLSVGEGSVSSYSKYVSLLLPDEDEIRSIEKSFDRQLDEIKDPSLFRSDVLYGIGGSVRAAAKLAGAAFYDGATPTELEAYEIGALRQLLRTDPSRFSHLAVKAVPERIHSIVPGCVIISELLAFTRAKSLVICKYGLREGYLVEHLLPNK